MSQTKNKNKKRAKPDEREWTSWSDTELDDDEGNNFLKAELDQILINRGEEKKKIRTIKGRAALVKYIKENHNIELDKDYDEYTKKQLMVELKLRKLRNDGTKTLIIQRMNGEIDDGEPLPKKARVYAQKKKVVKKKKNLFYAPLYTPPEGAEDTETQLVGVYKFAKKAYKTSIDKLLVDLEKEDSKKTIFDSITKKLDKAMEEKKWSEALEIANNAVEKAYGSSDKASFIIIHEKKIIHT